MSWWGSHQVQCSIFLSYSVRVIQPQGMDAAQITSSYWKTGEDLDHPDDVVLRSLGVLFFNRILVVYISPLNEHCTRADLFNQGQF